jgi:protein-S-isoprenylcysteine O-methyltransferase Ste14
MLGFVMVTFGFAWVARVEERFLRAELGAGAYDDYSARVPMLIPRAGGALGRR